jgi:predicted transcriptional regulator
MEVANMKNKETPNFWLQKLIQEHGTKYIDEIPEGWESLDQIAKHLGRPEASVRGIIQKMMRDGELQRKQFRIRRANGVMKVWHYSENTPCKTNQNQ